MKVMSKEGYIYCFRIGTRGDIYKIGKSKHPEVRKKQLQTSQPEDLILIGTLFVPNMTRAERFVHDMLAQYKITRELFRIPDYQYIESFFRPSTEFGKKVYDKLTQLI